MSATVGPRLLVTDYTALRAASETLRVLLKDHITDSADADIGGVQIDLRSPYQLEKANVTTAVSLWLFRVALQPDMLNLPLPRRSEDEYAHRPLPLELSYLVTALHPEAKKHLALTGRVLQIVNDHSRLRGASLMDTLAGSDAELRLSIDATTMIESSDLWYSLQSPFRLAVPVKVQVASIESHLPTMTAPPVLTRPGRTVEIVGAP